ncbi:MAG: hypothetical protein D6719_01055 [Candidatus Dadabacteria bacterium]|nr:MAG: hypothetical protein D6719_01055 [Candidatus Dadabacteria bacterium]
MERLLSLLIASITAAAILSALKVSLEHFQVITRNYSNTYRSERIKNEISRIVSSLDAHTLYIMPVIHKNGLIRLSDGTSFKAISNSKNHPPERNSSAISAITIDPERAYRITERKTSASGSALLRACPIYKNNSADKRPIRAWLALGASGIIYSKGKSEPVAATDGCRKFYLKKAKSAVLPSQPGDLLYSSFLIAVASEYTLYLDTYSTLRYASHPAAKLIENQPVITGLKSIDFHSSYSPDTGQVRISAKWRFKNSYSDSYSESTTLRRSDYLTYLLYLDTQ